MSIIHHALSPLECELHACALDVSCFTERSNMQKILDSVQNWSDTNKMKLNAKKTKDMWICFGKSIPQPPQSLYRG